MKLSKIYSNQEKLFNSIEFNNDSTGLLNVIYAEILDPKNKEKDSHNLGKTTLIHLLDFMFLKEINTKQSKHFLYKRQNIFKDFVFYLEILLNSGKFLTIRREVIENTKVSFKLHKDKYQDFTNINDEEWDAFKLPIDKAKVYLDSKLDLKVIKPWNYRTGINYFLRAQQDYNDYFQVSKFVSGKDSNWKPYMAQILGLNGTLLSQKYKFDEEIDILNKEKEIKAKEVSFSESDIDKLKNTIKVEEKTLSEISAKLDKFSFNEEEEKINKSLVRDVEIKISKLNNALFNVNYDIEKIEESLKKKIDFNLEEIKKVYDEAKIIFPEELLKDYEDLISFNQQISTERNDGLKNNLKKLRIDRVSLSNNLKELDDKRSKYLKILEGADSFKKYKALQNELSERKAQIIYFENQLIKLKALIEISKKIKTIMEKRNLLIGKINDDVQNSPNKYENIVQDFGYLVKKVLNKTAVIYTKQNSNGNLDFNIEIRKDNGKFSIETSEADGTSYRKLLCALFDLAILRAYANEKFFHFVYHDGVFEALDDRKKEKLLEVINESCKDFNIQYILSLIDTDLPRDDEDKKIPFPEPEIILRLNDSGKDGRLFKMEEF